jgi:ATP-dependent RNA helicase SUPV3L1/SUV3
LQDPAKWAERTREVEARLSDALHERLTQRFVDRRTAVLMRDLGKKGAGEFPVQIDDTGEVSVGSYSIGRLQGFAFEVDPAARHADRKMLLATAERRLAGEYENALRPWSPTKIMPPSPATPASRWRSSGAATKWRGWGQAESAVAADIARPADRPRFRARPRGGDGAQDWLRNQAEAVPALRAAGHAAQDPAAPAAVRPARLLVDEGGSSAATLLPARLRRSTRTSAGR